jgi:putative tryptophan/tyrosine transport system substrate-binding protein
MEVVNLGSHRMTHQFRFWRREFIKRFGAAVAVPLLNACTQTRELPIIGFLNSASPNEMSPFVAAFHYGLGEQGYMEGRNVAIEYRWADGQYERLPALAADLVDRRAVLIAATGGIVSARAALAATSTIPILFITGFDPVQIGFVVSLNRPGRNATGVSVYTTELMTKRLDLLRQMVPRMITAALLLNPDNTLIGGVEKEDLEAATRAVGLRMLVVQANAENDLEAAFASAVQQQAGAILVSADPFFTSRRSQLVALAERHSMPAGYPWREYVEAGGLMSYGPDIKDSYRQIGQYAGRIVKGATPNELPVQLPTRFLLTINRKTADALGLAVPRLLMVGADQIFE